MKIIFIRHGKTNGNLEKRYIGRTDETLCSVGEKEIASRNYPSADIVISSPMKRCVQTSRLIYPDKTIKIYDGLCECDFGDFEGKNYIELSENPDYQKWIDSGGTMPFPNGESHEDFVGRCVMTFENAVYDNREYSTVAFVVHGGTIMSILEKYAIPKKSFYDYQVKNGCGYVTDFEKGKIRIIEELL